MSSFTKQLQQETAGMTLSEIATYLQRRAKTLLRSGDYERAMVCDQLARQTRTLKKDVLSSLAEVTSYD